MRMINSFDSEIEFTNLEEAKKYYIPTKEVDADMRNEDIYLGDNFDEYIKKWEAYVSDIKNATDLNELCEVLNNNSDEFSNGSTWSVIE